MKAVQSLHGCGEPQVSSTSVRTSMGQNVDGVGRGESVGQGRGRGPVGEMIVAMDARCGRGGVEKGFLLPSFRLGG